MTGLGIKLLFKIKNYKKLLQCGIKRNPLRISFRHCLWAVRRLTLDNAIPKHVQTAPSPLVVEIIVKVHSTLSVYNFL